ncbi:MAG: FxsA family protein [Actinomycetota bacterium]
MPAFLILVFLVLPIAELAVLIQVGRAIGIGWTIVTLIAVSIAGAALSKREGLAVWRRFQGALRRGELPSKEILDGVLILFGAALLLTPGFISDMLGLVLLLPFSRAAVRPVMVNAGSWFIARRRPPGADAANRVRTVRSRRVNERAAQQTDPVDNH